MDAIRNVIIIGGGAAGNTAAIYTARAQLAPLMFEGFMAGGIAAGGQLTITSEVENFPGFPEGINGPILMSKMREQSINCGAEILTETVDAIKLSEDPFQKPFAITASEKTHYTRSIIIATGSIARRLGVKNEDAFWNKGISACAVCDGALPIFRDKPLLVVGGGDTACEEAHYLTKFASKVYMAVRRNELRASKAMQKRVLHHPKIEMLWETQLEEVQGDSVVKSAVLYESNNPSQKRTLEINGLFYAIGHTPNTAFLHGKIDLDDAGYIIANNTKTSAVGVFACGDAQDSKYRQAVTAAGSGCMAALEVEKYLSENQ